MVHSTEKQHIYRNEHQNQKYKYTNAEMLEAFSKPINIHYCGSEKPWTRIINKTLYWWYYANKTGYLNEIITYGKCNKDMVNRMSTLLNNHHEYIFNYK